MKACHFCAEQIQDHAVVCKHCGRSLVAPMVQPVQVHVHAAPRTPSTGVAVLLSFLIPGLGQIYKGDTAAGLRWLLGTLVAYVCLIVPGLIVHIMCIVDAAEDPPQVHAAVQSRPTTIHCQDCKTTLPWGTPTCSTCGRVFPKYWMASAFDAAGNPTHINCKDCKALLPWGTPACTSCGREFPKYWQGSTTAEV